MTTRYGILGWITLLSLVGSAQTSRASDFDTLLRAIPGDLPATIVVKNLSEFDAHVLRIVAHFDPRKARAGFVARLKAKLPFGNAVDLTKPVALCQVSTDNANETLMFVVVPNFEKKIERFESATRSGDVWQIPAGNDTVFVRTRGPFVVAAPTRSALASLDSEAPPLITKLGRRGEQLLSRDAFLHFDLHSVRDFLVNAVGQSAPLAPEIGAKLNVQLGIDMATATGAVGMVIDTVDRFLQQLAVIDVAVNIDNDAVDAALFATFDEGPITSYLGKQRPGNGTICANLPDEPFVLAAGYQFPGTESEFFDFAFDRAITNAALSGDQPGTETFRTRAALEHEVLKQINRGAFALSLSGLSMHLVGYNAGRDDDALLDAMLEASTNRSGPPADTGTTPTQRRIATTLVHEFPFTPDPSKPQAVFLTPLYGPDTRFAFAQRDGRVDYAIGNATQIDKRFSTSVTTSLSDTARVATTLEHLPKERNLELLIDPSGILPLVGPFIGITAPPSAESLSPIGIAATLSKHPARIDLHIPIQTITALAPPKPAPTQSTTPSETPSTTPSPAP